MPTPGVTLIGFLPEAQGVDYLKSACVVADPNDAAALSAEWHAARARLGPPVPNAGLPNIQALPPAGVLYVNQLVQQQWVQASFQQQPSLLGASFGVVELGPLLAYQYSVDMDRSDHHTNGVGAPGAPTPNFDELLEICLPKTQPVETPAWHQAPGSMMLTARNLNFRTLAGGYFNNSFFGLVVGVSLPFMHVTRLAGRSYLHNGYHRAVGLLRRGVTHAPCMIRDVATPEEAGIAPPGTFALPLLQSADPPTVAHLANGLAHPVQLKIFRRTLHVSWAEYATTLD